MRAARLLPCSPRLGDDRGGIVVGWLTKLTVVLALAGVVLFEAISVGTTAATVADQGAYAAHEASATWDQTKDIQQAYLTAATVAAEENPDNVVSTKSFTVDPDGTVHLVVSRDASTLLLFRWDRTAKWAHVSKSAQGRSVG